MIRSIMIGQHFPCLDTRIGQKETKRCHSAFPRRPTPKPVSRVEGERRSVNTGVLLGDHLCLGGPQIILSILRIVSRIVSHISSNREYT